MLNKFCGTIVEAMSESGLIEQNDIEICLFGIEIALLKLIHFTTMLMIGLYFGKVLETAAFIIFYSGLRVYAGGYHATSRLGCYCISWLMIVSVLLFVKFCPVQIMSTVSIGVSIPSYLIIYILAPVENINKPLDNIEKHHYRKIARIILAVELSISVVLLFSNIIQVLFIISLSLFSLAIMLILGKIQISRFV